jgi:hypothetical protein
VALARDGELVGAMVNVAASVLLGLAAVLAGRAVMAWLGY